jgi:hypothetical protein
MPAGEPDEEGNYPAGTVNGKVQARLAELAEKREELEKKKGEDRSTDEKNEEQEDAA